jgi:hypothetical protein
LPFSTLQCGVAEVDFAPATKQKSDSVSCYIVGAIVGHITDDDALLCGSLNINIVNPHAVADNHAAALQLLNNLTGYGASVRHDGVSVNQMRKHIFNHERVGEREFNAVLGEKFSLPRNVRELSISDDDFWHEPFTPLVLAGGV